MSDVEESWAVGGIKGVDEGSWMRGGGGGSVEQASALDGVEQSSVIPSLPPLTGLPSSGNFLDLDPIVGMDFMMWERERGRPTNERSFSFVSGPDLLSIGNRLSTRLDDHEREFEVVRCPDNPSAVHRYLRVTGVDPAESEVMPKPALQTGAEWWGETTRTVPEANEEEIFAIENGAEKVRNPLKQEERCFLVHVR